MKKYLLITVLILSASMLVTNAFAVEFIQAPPLSQVIDTPVGPVQHGRSMAVPMITWGGDIATIYANGNSASTSKGIFSERGLNLNLKRVDDFKKQIKMYLSGETPFLRGTMGMISMAAEVLNTNPGTKPVIIYQLTWSAGGDCLVVKDTIKTMRDLKGKTIAVQAYGPHVDLLLKNLKDVGLTFSDVNIKWVKDLTGTSETPGEALYERDVDACYCIIPDGLMLTSNGAVGIGSEGSVRGARILFSTRTASKVIADVYAVRSDFYRQNRDMVDTFVNSLLIAEQEIRNLFSNKQRDQREYTSMIRASAKLLLDSEQAVADTEALYADCTYAGFKGNVAFFSNTESAVGFARKTKEIQDAMIAARMLSTPITLTHGSLNYDNLRAGLTGIDDVTSPTFKQEMVAQVIERKVQMGTLDQDELISFEIFFQPNQKTFPAAMYEKDFQQVVDLASAYGGAVITVEGHSDPLGYLKAKKRGSTEHLLTKKRQAAKNLSMTRAIQVRNEIIAFAAQHGLPLDRSQFTVIGHGIENPQTGLCGNTPCAPKTEAEWRSNMRVVFRLVQIEAEASAFEAL